ncbi:uncharacterized protein [Pleurodeles waltl]|uniref:uncharacterized protein isoform X1 n=1 Tax=Pleurodeles waltl TaxID=8319 RepID=UPI003709C5F2
MEAKPTLEDMIKQLAESQRHLQLVWEAQQREAKEDREALQSALKSQATIMASNQLVHENALKKLTDTIAASKVHPIVPSSVLQKYQEGEDPDSFFTNFERVASSAQWPEDRWGQYIAPLLTGTLQSAYQAANPGGITPYSEIKKSVLERVGHNTEYYRTKFRKVKWGPNEDPRTYYYRVKDLGLKWLGLLGTEREDIVKVIVLEQYLDSLPSNTRNWIRQHPKVDTETAVDLACAYHRSGDGKQQSVRPVGKPPMTLPHFPTRRPVEESGPSRNSERSPIQQPQCFSCGEWGHIARGCPRKREGIEPMEIGVTRGRVLCLGKSDVSFKYPLQINGLPVMALIDSGCSQSVIRRSIIHPVQPTDDQWVTICCIHGDRAQYPLVTIEIGWNNHLDLLSVGLMDDLIEECVIGTDYQRFDEILDQTRKNKPIDDWWGTAPFREDSIYSSPTRKKLTCKEKRAEKHRYAAKQVRKEEEGLVALIDTAPISFRMSQHEDPSLVNAWKNAKTASTGEVGPYFLIYKDLLYRVITNANGEKRQLVVPEPYRTQVLFLAHNQPGGGHCGREKTEEYLLRRFYWPGVYAHIRRYCAQCPKCQLVEPGAIRKAPLRPLPIIDTPFKRVGMDLVGPLLPSSKGHTHILVLVDYASRYPEAIPLTSTTTKTVAQTMITFFARVGFPEALLTDQGTQFVSGLMKQICKSLGVLQRKTSVYHPQTDGLVERYNRTIKTLLRKIVNETGKDWDQKLPLVLYAIRTHEQSSTGHSPFELVFGRQPRNLLDMAAELWEEEDNEERPILDYIHKLKSHLQTVWEDVRRHLEEAQDNQKTYYDQGTKLRVLQPNDKVLILRPTSKHKLIAKWQGPYRIIRAVTPVTYLVELNNHPKRTQIYHINLLKKWEDPAIGNAALAKGYLITPSHPLGLELCPTSQGDPQKLPRINESLSDRETKQVKEIVHCHACFFSELPGKTQLVQHHIRTPEGKVVRLRPYRIPEARKTLIEEEITNMLSLGDIEASTSPWCSPIVLVPKPDGSVRFCIDFRKLNELSLFDTYPIPRVDEVLEKIGQARYMSTIDLTKGYWQIPLAPSDKEKTAFVAPSGLYQFTVLPFGLHGAPATFQRLMDQLLRPFHDFTAAYLDDIVIFSSTWSDHLLHLGEVFSAVAAAGLTANPKKCVLGQTQIAYLGYVIGKGMLRPQQDKVATIRQIPLPTTK